MPLGPEHQLQVATAAYLTLALPPTVEWTALDLANAPSLRAAQIRRARGAKPGWPDLLIAYGGRVHGIELKTDSGRLTDSQTVMFPRLERAGIPIAICRSIAEVEIALRSWGIPLRATTLTAQERDARLAAKAAAPKRGRKPRREKPDARTIRRVERISGQVLF